MRRLKIGDTVRAFLDANMCGVIENIENIPADSGMMVGGIPPVVAVATIRLPNGKLHKIRMTELYIEI